MPDPTPAGYDFEGDPIFWDTLVSEIDPERPDSFPKGWYRASSDDSLTFRLADAKGARFGQTQQFVKSEALVEEHETQEAIEHGFEEKGSGEARDRQTRLVMREIRKASEEGLHVCAVTVVIEQVKPWSTAVTINNPRIEEAPMAFDRDLLQQIEDQGWHIDQMQTVLRPIARHTRHGGVAVAGWDLKSPSNSFEFNEIVAVLLLRRSIGE